LIILYFNNYIPCVPAAEGGGDAPNKIYFLDFLFKKKVFIKPVSILRFGEPFPAFGGGKAL
jgi:hypothetical protein